MESIGPDDILLMNRMIWIRTFAQVSLDIYYHVYSWSTYELENENLHSVENYM